MRKLKDIVGHLLCKLKISLQEEYSPGNYCKSIYLIEGYLILLGYFVQAYVINISYQEIILNFR